MKKWYNDDSGNISATRIITVPGFYLSILLITAGIVLAFLQNPHAPAVITSGTGLCISCIGGKTVQKKFEEKGGIG